MNRQLLAKIHIAKKELGLEDEVYREALNSMFKVQSSKDLNDRQAVILIGHFKDCGWQPKSKPKKYDDQKGDAYSATPKQKRLIEVLWHSVYRGNSETKHLRQFLFNHFKVSDLRFLEKRTAYDAIEALKSMSKHRQSKVTSPKSEVGTEKI